ncbi:protein seele [Copidosoma floridanum]|uniref:protein seele n=1 Tax=Copidosoma floridanum TaxID=29053 RepID=UPI0006C946AF|nr:protein seele [Copidosoma floridanum]
MKLFIVLALFVISVSTHDIKLKQVKCLVCRTITDEFLHKVGLIDPQKKIEVGNYNIDSEGNIEHKTTQQSTSEIYLSGVLDEICKIMDDYVRATYKSNGKLTLMKLMTDDGKLNPIMSDVDIVQDDDLNKSLKYYCDEIINETEYDLIDYVKNKIEKKLKKDGICTEFCKEFSDNMEVPETDDDEFEKTEL